MAGKTWPWGNLTQVLVTCNRKKLLHVEASSSELEELSRDQSAMCRGRYEGGRLELGVSNWFSKDCDFPDFSKDTDAWH